MDEYDREIVQAERQASEEISLHTSTSSGSSYTSSEHGVDRTISKHPVHLERLHTQVLTHRHTVGSKADGSITQEELPAFGGGKPYPPEIPAKREDYVVDFASPDDPLHPRNWSLRTKLGISSIGALACICSTFASSIVGQGTAEYAKHWGVIPEVGSLASTLYLVGYAVGPSIFGPLSEIRGRKLPLLLGSLGFTLFAAAVATAKDIQTFMICRFFMGVFGSSPLVVTAGMYVDIWPPEKLGYALTTFVFW